MKIQHWFLRLRIKLNSIVGSEAERFSLELTGKNDKSDCSEFCKLLLITLTKCNCIFRLRHADVRLHVFKFCTLFIVTDAAVVPMISYSGTKIMCLQS